MDDNRFVSIFDVIGPIMVGPSSSHTAGAVRLGNIGHALLGCTPQYAQIGLHGSFAKTGKGHGTDRAIIAGLLGLEPSDERIRNSFSLAADCGLIFEFKVIDLGEEVHPNTVEITLRAHNKEVTYRGSSIGGGMVEITSLQNYPVSFNGELDTLIIIAADQPGTINTVTGWLVDQKVNIAYMKVGRNKRGDEAIMIFETDQPVSKSTATKIQELEWVMWSRLVPKLRD